jgi:hypothetical protein
MPPLTKPPITAAETERGLTEVLNELLKSNFTTTVDLFFNQTQLPTDAPKPQIHTVFTEIRPKEDSYDNTKRIVTAEADIAFFVRVANKGALANKTDLECRKLADDLKQIFQSETRFDLARKNILHARIRRGPTPLPTIGFQVRMLIVTAKLRYYIAMTPV